MSQYFDIGPDFIKEMKMGAFLTPPPDAKTKPVKGQSEPAYVWRETFVIQDIDVRSDGDGSEAVLPKFVVPSDVFSSNQGRVASEYFGFPWTAAQNGEKSAKSQCAISYRSLCEFARAAGYEGDITNLGAFQTSVVPELRNMRVDAQVSVGPDDNGTPRQHIRDFRAPK